MVGSFQFGTEVPPGLQFEGTFECETMASGRTSLPRTAMANFSFCRLRPSQDSRAVGKLPAIPRSLEYSIILYEITFELTYKKKF